MDGKYIYGAVAVVVVVLLVGSLLIPTIDNVTGGDSRPVVIDGAVPLNYDYFEFSWDYASEPNTTIVIDATGANLSITINGTTKTYDKESMDNVPILIAPDSFYEGQFDAIGYSHDNDDIWIYSNSGADPRYGYLSVSEFPDYEPIYTIEIISADYMINVSAEGFSYGTLKELPLVTGAVLPSFSSSGGLFKTEYAGPADEIKVSYQFEAVESQSMPAVNWIMAPVSIGGSDGPNYSTLFYTIPVIILIAVLVASLTWFRVRE